MHLANTVVMIRARKKSYQRQLVFPKGARVEESREKFSYVYEIIRMCKR